MKRYSVSWFLHHARNNSISTRLWSQKTLYLMAATRETRIPPQVDLPFKVDSWDDLEKFQPTERWHHRESFLADARNKLNQGIHCITLVQDSQLAFVDWVRPGSNQARFGHVDQIVLFPERVSTQFSGYVHPAHRGKGLFLEGMRRILDYVFEQTDTQYAFAGVEQGHTIAYQSHLKVGFEVIARMDTRHRLGRVRYSGQSLSPGFSLAASQSPNTWHLTTTGDQHGGTPA